MNPPHFSFPHRLLLLVLLGSLGVIGCEAPPKPAGPGSQYARAQDQFKNSNFDGVLDSTESMAAPTASGPFTERARVLRAIIYSARIRSYLELSDAYMAGAKATKNSQTRASYEDVSGDVTNSGARAALDLGQTAHDLLKEGSTPAEFTLDASYPAAEGPEEVTQLDRVRQGIRIATDVQAAAAQASMRKAVDDVLGEALGGDRTKARTALSGGSAKIPAFDFTFFLARQLLNGARALDRKHYNDAQKFKVMAEETEQTANAAKGYLKGKPDKAKEKEIKELLEQLKKERRAMNL